MFTRTSLCPYRIHNAFRTKEMNRCKLCVDPVLCSKNRRQLASLSSKHCRAVLTDLACEYGQSKSDAAKDYGEGYLCKKCFNAITKYSALQEEVQNRKSELLSKLSCHTASSGTPEKQGTKRSADTVPQAAHAVKVGYLPVRSRNISSLHRLLLRIKIMKRSIICLQQENQLESA